MQLRPWKHEIRTANTRASSTVVTPEKMARPESPGVTCAGERETKTQQTMRAGSNSGRSRTNRKCQRDGIVQLAKQLAASVQVGSRQALVDLTIHALFPPEIRKSVAENEPRRAPRQFAYPAAACGAAVN